MRTSFGVSHSVPSGPDSWIFWVAIIGIGAVLWFVADLIQQSSRRREVAAHASEQQEIEDRAIADAERRHRLALERIAEIDASLIIENQKLAEIKARDAEIFNAKLQIENQKLADLVKARDDLVKQWLEAWQAELGETAMNVRSNLQMLCPHCQHRGSVNVADLVSGMTVARCRNCDSSWKF